MIVCRYVAVYYYISYYAVVIIVTGRTMLRSYYDTLWQSFPQDHLITLSRLCDLLPVEERLVETIALYPTSEHDVANRRILNAALSNVKRDNELLGFCLLVEKLIASPNKAKVTEKMKSGQFYVDCHIYPSCVCIYVCVQIVYFSFIFVYLYVRMYIRSYACLRNCFDLQIVCW